MCRKILFTFCCKALLICLIFSISLMIKMKDVRRDFMKKTFGTQYEIFKQNICKCEISYPSVIMEPKTKALKVCFVPKILYLINQTLM